MEEEKMVKKENEVTNMNDSKNKNGIIAVLIVIIIALIGAVVYFAFIKNDDKLVDNNGNNQQQQNNNQNNSENEGNDILEIDEKENAIKKINYTEYKNSLKKYNNVRIEENDNNQLLQYSIWHSEVELSSDGRVKIVEKDKQAVMLSNISNGKAIQGGDGYFYILLNTGDVYYYNNSRYSDGIYTAIKVEGISNISKFVESSYCSKLEKFCVDDMGIVDENGMYIELESVMP